MDLYEIDVSATPCIMESVELTVRNTGPILAHGCLCADRSNQLSLKAKRFARCKIPKGDRLLQTAHNN